MNKKIQSQDEVKALIKKSKRFCGLCKEEDTMLICMECRRRHLEEQKVDFQKMIEDVISNHKIDLTTSRRREILHIQRKLLAKLGDDNSPYSREKQSKVDGSSKLELQNTDLTPMDTPKDSVVSDEIEEVNSNDFGTSKGCWKKKIFGSNEMGWLDCGDKIGKWENGKWTWTGNYYLCEDCKKFPEVEK